jgi:U3 small nucleolar RNA-associated protein MPP10
MEHEFKNALGLPTNASEKNAKQELFNIFRDLCFKLDSLTNLSFQPRGFIKAGEIKVSSTIDREEKVPLTYTKSG